MPSKNQQVSQPAPFKHHGQRVEEDWIDYNGHLNMAYYHVLFDRCVDAAFATVGLGPDYVKICDASFFTAEVHVCYLRELGAGDEVEVTLQLLDFDEKRVHFFQELVHHDEGWLSATSEQMCLHVDMNAKKVSPFPASILTRLQAMKQAHAPLPRSRQLGRVIGIRR